MSCSIGSFSLVTARDRELLFVWREPQLGLAIDVIITVDSIDSCFLSSSHIRDAPSLHLVGVGWVFVEGNDVVVRDREVVVEGMPRRRSDSPNFNKDFRNVHRQSPGTYGTYIYVFQVLSLLR